MARRDYIAYGERRIFAQVVAVDSMFLLQRFGASEVEDEVWLSEQSEGSNRCRRRLM
jgi:hypothetical protein